MQNHGPSVVSPIGEMDHYRSSPSHGARRVPTGGNRSWSEEEEAYLLQTRMQKMPYKHIAAHLKKTELACRLHYHQLSHASHRRKRHGSVCSSASSGSMRPSPNPSQYHLGVEQYERAVSESPPQRSSPSQYGDSSPAPRYGSANSSPARTHQKYLLPKPRPHTPQSSPESLGGLRINTADSVIHRAAVDTERLRAIYESRRAAFWASIAAEYGTDVSPVQLEDIFRHGFHAPRPPTPGVSPEDSTAANVAVSGATTLPSLKPPFFPPYPSNSAVDRPRGQSPVGLLPSAVSAPDRMPYLLPTPTPSTATTSTPSLARWGPTPTMPATAISALLTEDRNPRREMPLEGRA